MASTEVYTFEVLPGTRNHRGVFVRETTYKLIGIDQSGWAFICQDNATCHYVDPDSLQTVGVNSNS